MPTSPITLSLHQLCLMEIPPEELIDIAAAEGCRHVCFFIRSPGFQGETMVADAAHARGLKRRMDDLGLSAFNCDTVVIGPATVLADYDGFMEAAAALGGRTVNILNLHPDLSAAADMVAAVAARARQYGLDALVEPFRFSETRTLADAGRLLDLAGDPTVAINIDVLHLMRNGGKPSDIAAIPPARLPYFQISDGPLDRPLDQQMQEAGSGRMEPGTGAFPLIDFVRHLPGNGILCVEAPVAAFKGRLAPREQARRLIVATRGIVEQALQAEKA